MNLFDRRDHRSKNKPDAMMVNLSLGCSGGPAVTAVTEQATHCTKTAGVRITTTQGKFVRSVTAVTAPASAFGENLLPNN